MVTTPFTIRLGVRDADTVRRALAGMGADGEAALRKIDRAARQAEAGSKAARGGIAGMSSELGSLALRFAGPAAAIAALTAGVTALVKAGSEFQKQQFTIQQLLVTTGNASGQTAAQIEALAQSIGRNTLQSTEGVREAAAALLTFRNVSGDAFGRTLTVAADLSAVMGTDLRSATLQLGKALEDPERNLSQLNRSGISFSQTQIDVIKRMKETGDAAGALNEILKAIEGQLGGAGVAQAGGLAGAWDSFGEALNRRLEILSRTGGALDLLARGIRNVAGALEAANERATPAGQLALRQGQLRALEDELARTPAGIGGLLTGRRVGRAEIANEISKEREAIRDLRAEIEDLDEAEAMEAATAAAGAEAHKRQAAADRAAAEAKKLLKIETGLATRAAVEEEKARAAASERARKIIEDDARRNRSVEQYIAGLETAAELETLSAEQKDIQRAILEAQNRLIDEQGVKLRDLTDEERRRIEQAVRQTRELEKQREAAKKYAEEVKRQADRIADNLSRALGDVFFDRLNGESGDFWETFEQLGKRAIANLAAEIVTQQLFRPVINGVAGSLFGPGPSGQAPGRSGAGSGLGSLLGGLFGGSSSFDPSVGAPEDFGGGIGPAGGPAGIGGSLAQVANFFPTSLFSGGGGAAGGVASNLFAGNLTGAFAAVPVWGWIALAASTIKRFVEGAEPGTLKGTVNTLLGPSLEEWLADPLRSAAVAANPLGTAIGDFFGNRTLSAVLNPLTLFSRKPSVGPAGGANLGVGGPGGTLRFFGSGGDNGFDASGFVELANQARDVLNATVTALGGQFGTTRGQLNAIGSFASRGGVFTTVQTHGSQPLDANGPSDITRFFGGDTNAAINDLLIRTFKNFEIIGVAPEVRSAIVNSVATTWEAFLDDLNFAAALAGVEFNAPEITAAEQAIAAINEQFAELAGRATALGIATAQLEAARERALADLTEGFDASIAAQILAFTDPAHGAMDALIAAQEARLREAEALGADLVEVERLAGLERTRLVAATLGDINALLSELTVGALSQATPAARLDAARTAFEEARALALAGETVADLAATVRAFIETSRAVQATGGTFGGDIGAAIDLLEQLQGQGFAHGGIARGPSLFGEAGPEAAIPLDSGMRIPVAEVRLGGAVDQGLRELVRLGETGRLNEEAGAALTRRLIGEIQGLRRDLRAAQPPRQVAA